MFAFSFDFLFSTNGVLTHTSCTPFICVDKLIQPIGIRNANQLWGVRVNGKCCVIILSFFLLLNSKPQNKPDCHNFVCNPAVNPNITQPPSSSEIGQTPSCKPFVGCSILPYVGNHDYSVPYNISTIIETLISNHPLFWRLKNHPPLTLYIDQVTLTPSQSYYLIRR